MTLSIFTRQAANEASFAMADGEFAKAKRLLDVAFQNEPDIAEGWVARGMVAAGEKDFVTARAFYEKALALHAARYEADRTRANEMQQQVVVLMLLARRAEANDLLQVALVRHPHDSQLKLLADSLRLQGSDWRTSPYALQET